MLLDFERKNEPFLTLEKTNQKRKRERIPDQKTTFEETL